MKYLIWVVLILVILLLMRVVTGSGSRLEARAKRDDGARASRTGSGAAQGRSSTRPGDEQRRPQELMLRCTVCGVHMPASDAIFAGGRVYCGAEHRDVDAGQ